MMLELDEIFINDMIIIFIIDIMNRIAKRTYMKNKIVVIRIRNMKIRIS